ncbi:MAG: hypothetical protein ACTSRS_11335 [Candidatus Helarchaeota archaeon]
MADLNLTRFEQFLERVIGESKLELEGGKLSKAFLNESQRSSFILSEFFDAFTPRWDLWKRKRGSHNISPFIEEQGRYFLKIWLTFIYPFNYRRLVVEAAKGGSLVDTNGMVGYAYTPEERAIIKKICDKYGVDMPEREVARILITNAIKSLDPSISKIIETNYRMFIDKIDFFEKEDNLAIKVAWVGRIG